VRHGQPLISLPTFWGSLPAKIYVFISITYFFGKNWSDFQPYPLKKSTIEDKTIIFIKFWYGYQPGTTFENKIIN
jgi:hypothetical protein